MPNLFHVFEPLVRSFQLRAPFDSPDWDNISIASEQFSSGEAPGSPTSVDPEIRLWFDRTVTPGVEAFAKKLISWAEQQGVILKSHQGFLFSSVCVLMAAIAAYVRKGATIE